MDSSRGFGSTNFDDLRRLIESTVSNAVNHAMDRRSPGPSGPPGPPGPPGEPATPPSTYGSSQPTIRAQDIGYFDPDSDKEPVEVKETHQVYHNVFSFTNRLKARAITMDIALLRNHLPSCLIGKAER